MQGKKPKLFQRLTLAYFIQQLLITFQLKFFQELSHFYLSPVEFSLTSLDWTSKGCRKRYFTEETLINVVSHLRRERYFTILTLYLNKMLVFL